MGSVAGPIPSSWNVDPSAAGAREVADGVWRLRLPWSWEGVDHVNAYLLTDGERHALVDTGPGGHPTNLAAFEHALRATGVTVEQIDRVILTHAHSDHVGMLGEIVRRDGAEVLVHADTEHVDEIITRPEASSAARMRRARAEGVPDEALEWFGDLREEVDTIGAPMAPDHVLVPGRSIDSPIGTLEVSHAPGHAPSQVALLQRERGLVFVGDAVCSVFSPYYDYGFSPDPVGEQLATLDRLEAIDALALPGHGRPLDDLAGVARDTRAAIGGELDAVRAAVAEGPAGAYEVSRRAFGEPASAFVLFLRTAVTAGYLRHLRFGGEVAREERDGRFRHSAVG